jgi:hypothetical protein
MVHGNACGLQYEIHLTKPLDFFQDVIPIWTATRTRIEYKEYDGKFVLIVLSPHQLEIRSSNLHLIREYFSGIFEPIERMMPSSELRAIAGELGGAFKWHDVKLYKTHLKHNANMKPFREFIKELHKKPNHPKAICENRYYELLNQARFGWHSITMEEHEELNLLTHEINIHRLLSNSTYFEEIVELEKQLTTIDLTDKEEKLIAMILNHPTIEELVKWHGISLVEWWY